MYLQTEAPASASNHMVDLFEELMIGVVTFCLQMDVIQSGQSP